MAERRTGQRAGTEIRGSGQGGQRALAAWIDVDSPSEQREELSFGQTTWMLDLQDRWNMEGDMYMRSMVNLVD
jgi:hypothetical protein